MQIVIETNFAEVGAKLARAGAETPELIARGLGYMAEAVGEAVVPILEAHTPVRTGTLRDSTDKEISVSGLEATIGLIQPATNEAGQQYGQWVVEGHRIVTRGGHDTGRRVPPNPYPDEAMSEAEPAIDAATTEGADRLAREIVSLI